MKIWLILTFCGFAWCFLQTFYINVYLILWKLSLGESFVVTSILALSPHAPCWQTNICTKPTSTTSLVFSFIHTQNWPIFFFYLFWVVHLICRYTKQKELKDLAIITWLGAHTHLHMHMPALLHDLKCSPLVMVPLILL